MKRIISLLLTILTVCTLTIGISGCGGASQSAVVGVWKKADDPDTKTTSFINDELYIYVYKDGTGDYYAKQASVSNENAEHFNSFEWEIDGEYFVEKLANYSPSKYTINGDTMLDKQGKEIFTKVSDDTSIDIEIIYEPF